VATVKITDPESRWLLGWNVQGDLADWTFYETSAGAIVAFPKAPPKSPPSNWQKIQRGRFSAAALAWQTLPHETRNAWERATLRLSLGLNGYNLWVYWHVKRDTPAIRTIECLSGEELLPP
jgi:alpha-ketoglutarate-dependent taurine dioxygenase